jgi:quercetin dioxygenase-like cupin family protein
VLGLAELSGASQIGKHTHPGIEQGTLIAGELILMVEGQPNAVYRTGQSWMIAAATPHDAKAGPAGAKVIAV